MTTTGYMIWFLAMAVFTAALLGVGIVAATGYWSQAERSRRRGADPTGPRDQRRDAQQGR